MTKEQEVFEKVNRIRIDFFDSKYKDVHTDDELEEKYEALGDVLNMLKEKDKEIENLKMEKDEAWEEWNNLEQGTYEEEQRLKSAIKKKNKIIDLMAEYIANRDNDEDICKYQVAEWCEDEEDGVLIEVCRKCIKQYFERKCEE